MKKIGFIGYGLRSETMVQAFTSMEADISIAAIADPRCGAVREKWGDDPRFAHTAYYESAEEMLEKEALDGVFIGTRCALHTPLACLVLQKELPLFLEKPVCISKEQFLALREAGRGQESRVVVSFPLRVTALVQAVKAIVESGSLGRITMVQAVNNVPYGSVYYHSWYRSPAETGGLFLQKATHDIDYIQYLLGEHCQTAAAKTAKLHFKGDKPAGLRCPACKEYRSCPESPFVVKKLLREDVQGDWCCFAEDTGNEDCASAIFTTQSGALLSYNQNFVVKKTAGRRGARLVGTKSSLEFDFYTGDIRHDLYQSPSSSIHHITLPTSTHFGGDEALALDFMRVLEGQPASASLRDGLAAAAACLAAKEADETGCFVPVASV